MSAIFHLCKKSVISIILMKDAEMIQMTVLPYVIIAHIHIYHLYVHTLILVCIHSHACTHAHSYSHGAYIYTHNHTYIHTHMHIMLIHTHRCIHMLTCAHGDIHIQTCTHVYLNTYTSWLACVHTHTQLPIPTYSCTHFLLLLYSYIRPLTYAPTCPLSPHNNSFTFTNSFIYISTDIHSLPLSYTLVHTAIHYLVHFFSYSNFSSYTTLHNRPTLADTH